MRKRWSGLLVAASLLCGSGLLAPAYAQAKEPTEAQKNEARERYERGLKLYEDGAFDAARIEIERAYELSPTFKLLYNIGIVRAQLSDFVGAVKNLDRYLAEGGDQVPPARRAEVTKLLTDLRPRIATVSVTTSVPGADVFVDDVAVGRTPLTAPVDVNPGRRKISASKAGWLPASKVIDVGGSDKVDVGLTLSEASKTVVINTGTRRVPWVGWIATGALAVGAGAFGYMALSSSSDLEKKRGAENADPDELDSGRTKTKTFSYLADGLTIAAVIVGGISLYYTIKWGKEDANKKEVRLVPGPGSFAMQGSF